MRPAEVLRRISRYGRPFLLESSSNADGCGRYSYAGCDPVGELEWSLGDPGDPFALLQERLRTTPAIAVGFLGYGLASCVEPRLRAASDDRGMPELSFGFYDALWRFDHTTGRSTCLGPGAALLRDKIDGAHALPATASVGEIVSSLDEVTHRARLREALRAIEAGEVYQLNLTHRLQARWRGDPAALFAAVRRTPAPFGACIDLGKGRALIANSPERFLRVQGRLLESRPIKGTGAPTERGAAALARSEKERAEHVMIVDLMRSDLGRVCATGSIDVDGFRRIVRYPTLHHMVSTVRGLLREGVGIAELLRATFPGGSVTGAPKVRAMQLIGAIEGHPRGPYTGAFGCIWPPRDGAPCDLDLAMTIRTAVCSPGWLDIGVGGGIVADSRPEAEWAETWLKARAWTEGLAHLASAEPAAQAPVLG